MDYFEEKEDQIVPSRLQAFGIDIYSRYGKSYEIIEMINFAEETTKCGLNCYIKSIFYNTKAGMCEFEFTQDLSTEINSKLKIIALATIGQFTWSDVVYHGAPLMEMEDEF